MTPTIKTHLKRKGYDLTGKSEKEIIDIFHNEYYLEISKAEILKNCNTKVPIIAIGNHCLYVLIDKKEIVYVGITKKLLYRVGEHQKNKIFDSVFVIEIDENKIEKEEFKYICKFKPKNNGEIISENSVVNYVNKKIY